jgi:hypothetical protein
MSGSGLGPTLPPLQWILGAKWPGYEVGHLTASNAEVKNEWSYIFPTVCLYLYGIDRDNFVFLKKLHKCCIK